MLQHARARECCSTRARAHGPPAGAAAAVPLNRAAARAHWLRTEEALGRRARAQGGRAARATARGAALSRTPCARASLSGVPASDRRLAAWLRSATAVALTPGASLEGRLCRLDFVLDVAQRLVDGRAGRGWAGRGGTGAGMAGPGRQKPMASR